MSYYEQRVSYKDDQGTLLCDMRGDCFWEVTHIGSKGYIYCELHARQRVAYGYESARKLRVWEVKLIESGKQVPSYVYKGKRV